MARLTSLAAVGLVVIVLAAAALDALRSEPDTRATTSVTSALASGAASCRATIGSPSVPVGPARRTITFTYRQGSSCVTETEYVLPDP